MMYACMAHVMMCWCRALQQRDRPLAMWGLSTVLTVSDADFATRLAGVEPEFYLRFRKAREGAPALVISRLDL